MENTIAQTEEKELLDVALGKFDVNEAKIAEFKQQYGSLKINGLDDKEGYESVRLALSKLRGTRTGIEARRKEIKKPYLEVGKKIDEAAEKYTVLIEDIEKPLRDQKETIDAEKEKIRIEKERAEQERLNARVAMLFGAGMSFNGSQYSINDVVIDTLDIKGMDDPQWKVFMERVQVEVEKVNLIKEEEERAKAEEAEKLKAEAKRLDDIRIEQEAKERKIKEEEERIRKEQDEERERLRAEQEKKAEELAEKEKALKEREESLLQQKIDARCKQILSMGMQFMPDQSKYVFDMFEVHHVDMVTLTDSEWDKLIAETSSQLSDYKKEKEAARIKNEKEEAEQKRLKEEETEKQREALKPEREKMLEFASKLESMITYPQVSHQRYADAIRMVKDTISDMKQELEKVANQ